MGKCAPGCTCGRHKFGPDHPNWGGDNITHSGQLQRVRSVRGNPVDYPCAHCIEHGITRPAHDWAHVHGESGLDVWADFIPLCRKSHMDYDGHGHIGGNAKGAGGRMTGKKMPNPRKHSPETRAKMRASQQRRRREETQ